VGPVVYYVSGHGFGHAVRSAETIRALFGWCSDISVHVRTSAPIWLFPSAVHYHPVELDVGVVQRDALHVDAAATLNQAAALARGAERLVAREAAFLRQLGASLAVGDIPPLAFLAAERAGLPSVAVANFAWDWIYNPYVEQHPSFAWLLEWLRRAYACAGLLLRLPFYGDLSAFQAIEDVPLISRPATAPRAVLRARLGLDPDRRVVLLSFGGLGLGGFDPRPLASLAEYLFLATEKEVGSSTALPPNVRLLTTRQENYSDLVGACDVVVTKPGFGIVANCLALQVPLLYTDRGDFPEYRVLAEAVHRHGRGRYLPQDDLRAGRLGPHLDQLLQQQEPWSALRTDGAEVIAARLLQQAGETDGEPQAGWQERQRE
jgi:L-arabinokinase